MENEKDFDKVGKKMPYTVPSDFFDTLEGKVRDRAAHEAHVVEIAPARRPAFNLRRAIAAAACIAVLIAAGIGFYQHQQPRRAASMADVEMAYDQLSEQDQQYILDLSQDDIFINEQNY